MASDPKEDPRQKQAIFEIAQLGTRILSDSKEFSKKIEEIANLGIAGFNFVLIIRGLEPVVKRIRKPEFPVKFSELALTGNDRELAKKAGIKIDEREVGDLKKAFSEILQERKSNVAAEVDANGAGEEVEETADDDQPVSHILSSIGSKLHAFSGVHRILFVFGLSKISLFKHLNLYRYLNGESIVLLMNERGWMDVLEKIFRSVLKAKEPEIKKGLILSLESYILCIMKTVECFENFED